MSTSSRMAARHRGAHRRGQEVGRCRAGAEALTEQGRDAAVVAVLAGAIEHIRRSNTRAVRDPGAVCAEQQARSRRRRKAKDSDYHHLGEQAFVCPTDCVPKRASHSSNMPPHTPPRRLLEDQLTTQARRSHGGGECSDCASEMPGSGRSTRWERVPARSRGRRERSSDPELVCGHGRSGRWRG
jgi:hypothetical protein